VSLPLWIVRHWVLLFAAWPAWAGFPSRIAEQFDLVSMKIPFPPAPTAQPAPEPGGLRKMTNCVVYSDSHYQLMWQGRMSPRIRQSVARNFRSTGGLQGEVVPASHGACLAARQFPSAEIRPHPSGSFLRTRKRLPASLMPLDLFYGAGSQAVSVVDALSGAQFQRGDPPVLGLTDQNRRPRTRW